MCYVYLSDICMTNVIHALYSDYITLCLMVNIHYSDWITLCLMVNMHYSNCIMLCLMVNMHYSDCIMLCLMVNMHYSDCITLCLMVNMHYSDCIMLCLLVSMHYSDCITDCITKLFVLFYSLDSLHRSHYNWNQQKYILENSRVAFLSLHIPPHIFFCWVYGFCYSIQHWLPCNIKQIWSSEWTNCLFWCFLEPYQWFLGTQKIT